MWIFLGFVADVVFLLGIALYARYVFRRIAGVGAPSMVHPRGRQLILFWLALVFTVIVIIPAVIVGVGYALGINERPSRFSPGEPWMCSSTAHGSFLLLGIVLGLPLAALWIRVLLRLTTRASKHDD